MSRFIIVTLVIFLSACGTHIEPVKNSISDFKGLEDCSAYQGRINGASVTIVRCPNSTTSVNSRQGKTSRNTITVDE